MNRLPSSRDRLPSQPQTQASERTIVFWSSAPRPGDRLDSLQDDDRAAKVVRVGHSKPDV